jgi:hypothetical protein
MGVKLLSAHLNRNAARTAAMSCLCLSITGRTAVWSAVWSDRALQPAHRVQCAGNVLADLSTGEESR